MNNIISQSMFYPEHNLPKSTNVQQNKHDSSLECLVSVIRQQTER